MTSSDGDRLLRLLCSLDANSVGTLYAFLEATARVEIARRYADVQLAGLAAVPA